ncbi:MAG: zinc-dependent alcohol dehydrogenase family protein [Planctomycetales bacterium]|nr:zinc-dependent alcohol dehydrogenase family protein [Planctomycetales bacterium]
MKAIYFDQFQTQPMVKEVDDPLPPDDGVVVEVKATGLCRSDWHGWMGHDPDIQLPHVPGHELAGVVLAKGDRVAKWQVGDRVTVPFCLGCGACRQCHNGNQHICDAYYQPGFKGWGSFAERVALPHADENLVRIPDDMEFTTAASLGCRFVTSFRAIVYQGKVSQGEWVAVHGCGGVGLSAVMIAKAVGAKVIAVDIHDAALELAQQLGADFVVNAAIEKSVVRPIRRLTDQEGAHVSIDALGSGETCRNSIRCLRKQGRHVQVGLIVGDENHNAVPLPNVIARELEIVGSHGMQAHAYPTMLDMIQAGKLDPQQLVQDVVSLEDAAALLPKMDSYPTVGMTIIRP